MIYALLGPVGTIKLVFTFIFRTQCLIFSSCPIKRTKIILKLQLKFYWNYQKHWLGHWIPDLDLDLDFRGEDLDLDLDSDCEDLTRLQVCLYDFWCAQTCSFRAVFGLPIRSLLLSALYNVMRKNIYRCTSTLSVLNYCSGILFKSLSYLYEVVRTNFSADFWTFRNFWPQFRENCGATEQRKWELLVHLKGQSILKKRWKPHQNRPTNRHTILVWTMSPTRRQTKRDIQKKHQISLLQPARVVRSPPNFAWW